MKQREALGRRIVYEAELLLGVSQQGVGRRANALVIRLPSPNDSTKERPAEKGSGERSERLVGRENEHRRRLNRRATRASARRAAREDGRREENATAFASFIEPETVDAPTPRRSCL